MIIKEHGLYTVNDKYFMDFPSKYWMQNKSQNRPHYYSMKDPSGILWFIPMSTKVENYSKKIAKEEEKRGKGNCIFYQLGKVGGIQRAFIISDLFPMVPEYIIKPYTIKSVEYIVKDEPLNREIRSKAVKYVKLLESHVLRDRNEILKIRNELITEYKNIS